jgi:cytochrome P450 family 110
MTEALVQPSFSEQSGSSVFSRALNDVRYALDTLGFYHRLQATGQRPFSARLMMGDFWGTGDPDLARQIYTAPAEQFGDPVGPRVLEPLLGSRSILLLGGDVHRRDRALLMPPFHGERMRAYGQVIAQATLLRSRAVMSQRRVSITELMPRISLDAILEAVFGLTEQEHAEVEQLVLEAVHCFTVPLMFFPILRAKFFGLSPWDRFLRARKALDARLLRLIEGRRQSGQRGEDILSLMLDAKYEDGSSMHEEQLRDELVTMIMAGHETSAIALSWTVDHLLRDPSALSKLRQELATIDVADFDALVRLPYLGAVCSEGLRLHPIVADISRSVVQGFTWGAQPVEPGDQVAVAICLLHENPELYPEPMRFRPERFLERSFKPWEYCPFGGGNRRCIGAAFAVFEMKIALATLLSHFELTLLDARPPRPVRRNVTMGPDSKLPVRLAERRA